MEKLRIAFYKASNGQFDDKFIDKFSGNLGYSHCEVVLNESTMIGAHYLADGVNTFYYNNIYTSGYWDVLELDLPSDLPIEYANTCIGVGYDVLGVVLYFIGLTFGDDKDKVWCSEFCARVINKATNEKKHKLIEDVLIMPNDLYAYMKDELGATRVTNLKSKKRARSTKQPEIDRFGRIK